MPLWLKVNEKWKHDLPFSFQLTWTRSYFQNMHLFISYTHKILSILHFHGFFKRFIFLNSASFGCFRLRAKYLDRSEIQCYNYCLFLATMTALYYYTFWRLQRNIWLLFELKAECSSFSAELSKQSKIVTSRFQIVSILILKLKLKMYPTKSS